MQLISLPPQPRQESSMLPRASFKGARGLAAKILALALPLSACVTTPVTDRRALILVPEAQMTELGSQAFAEVLAESKISDDPQLIETVNRIGRRVAAATGAEGDWEFVVIDDPQTVNAFALPGGKIAVYTGLLPVARTEAGLAAVLGHEIAHVTAQHSAERISQAMILQLGLSAAQLSLSDEKYGPMLMGLLGVGAQLGVMLPYSRLHENEADEIGLRYMAEAGYDPNEAVALWERMGEASGAAPPEFLSTHPNPSSRVAQLRAQIGSVMPVYAASDRQPNRSLPVAH